ncbi:MAG TPA: hypothetical protein PK728_03540 [Bacillota bacterium]|nr:hypothetical protein [Bacillota bacterium]
MKATLENVKTIPASRRRKTFFSSRDYKDAPAPGKNIPFQKLLAVLLIVCCLSVYCPAALRPAGNIIAERPAGEKTDTPGKIPGSVAGALPAELQFKPVDIYKLQNCLHERNSLLADGPYFTAILKTAEEFNINPLLLFAITGQEQAFVPRNGANAKKIANNPFNVHRSWQEYNTDIGDASRIAAITIINLSRNRPETADPVSWINRTYSEDKNWWQGVRKILEELESETRWFSFGQ